MADKDKKASIISNVQSSDFSERWTKTEGTELVKLNGENIIYQDDDFTITVVETNKLYRLFGKHLNRQLPQGTIIDVKEMISLRDCAYLVDSDASVVAKAYHRDRWATLNGYSYQENGKTIEVGPKKETLVFGTSKDGGKPEFSGLDVLTIVCSKGEGKGKASMDGREAYTIRLSSEEAQMIEDGKEVTLTISISNSYKAWKLGKARKESK